MPVACMPNDPFINTKKETTTKPWFRIPTMPSTRFVVSAFLLGLTSPSTAFVLQTSGVAPSKRSPPGIQILTRYSDIPSISRRSTSLRASSLDVGILNIPENATEPTIAAGDSSEVSSDSLPISMVTLPRHSHEGVNEILTETEHLIQNMHKHSKNIDPREEAKNMKQQGGSEEGGAYDAIFANTYVDLGQVETIGFDYDYTLVTYTEELLELIYDMALRRLVHDRQYPLDMLDASLAFDPFFSIRGLAVDKDTGWICHLSYTHKVAVAWEGREKVPTSRIYKEYRGKRALNPKERRSRLKPLNDLFSMAECCLIADTIQFFKDRNIEYCPNNVVRDILGAIGDTHISGDFHRIVANDPARYFHPTPHLKSMLTNLKESGKRLIFASNSPFWYVNEGMKYVLGDDWMEMWDTGMCVSGSGRVLR